LPRSVAPFRIELRASRVSRGWLGLVHGLALLACLFNGLPIWSRAVLACLVLVSGGLSVKTALLAPGVRELQWQKDKGWLLATGQGQELSAQLLGSSRVWTRFALLHFAAGNRRLNLVVWPDSLEPEDFRRLRVLLTVEGPD
jgi:hypothetical protein